MAKTREEIDELIRQHEEGTHQMGKDQVWYEIKYIVEFVITYIVLSLLLYTGMGLLISYTQAGQPVVATISSTAQYFAGTVMFITGIIYAFSFFVGMSTFQASMMVRAWGGGKSRTLSDRGLMDDMRTMMNPGEVIKGMLLGSVVTLVFYYFYFDQVFL